MNWPDVLWIFIASSCLTLAFTHARVLAHRANVRPSAALTLMAVSVALVAIEELHIHRSMSLAELAPITWRIQFPIAAVVIGIVWFLDGYVTGRTKVIGWIAAGLRMLGLLIHIVLPSGIVYRELIGIERIQWLGATFTVCVGTANPWILVNQIALLLLLLYLGLATVEFWRKGDRRRAINLGGALFVLIGGGVASAIVVIWGLVRMPIALAPFFLPIIVGMSRELGYELVRAGDMQHELAFKEAQLRESEAKMLAAADAAEAGLWSADMESGDLWATPRALRMFELDPGCEHDISEVMSAIHPDDRQRVQDALTEMQSDGEPSFVEYRVALMGGNMRWYLSRGGVHRDIVTNRRYLMGTTTDITTVKTLQMELELQRSEIAHLSRVSTLSEMSGSIAHEINQPLTAILSNAQAGLRFISGSNPQYDEIEQILCDIVENDRRASEIITGLRRMLKKGEIQQEQLEMRDIVAGVLALTRSDCINKMVRIELTGFDAPLQVCGDRVQLQQVLINLITNAVDAMADVPASRRVLAIQAGQTAGQRIQLLLSDHGPGFKPADLGRVFTPFYTTKPNGLGLGLAICRQIVAAHGGELMAENGAQGGAVLRLSLPVSVEFENPPVRRATA